MSIDGTKNNQKLFSLNVASMFETLNKNNQWKTKFLNEKVWNKTSLNVVDSNSQHSEIKSVVLYRPSYTLQATSIRTLCALKCCNQMNHIRKNFFLHPGFNIVYNTQLYINKSLFRIRTSYLRFPSRDPGRF